ncbi:hypothetical protein BSL78_24949 [Apostichopus japonicus]|uniref:Tesmin/TSO1-like CXC domain-containing protein n=1 Tax=Stichopus japonicus TaxID=307972 RepID=A0A2G8JR73_STIJA|nr:hypothetical protein BSL78_24949 [Apostichopus japonicus]
MKKLQLKTFTTLSRTVKWKINGKEFCMKADRNLLARLVVIGRFRSIDLHELMKYALRPLPLSLATPHGSLVKTNKANLLHALEDQTQNAIVEIPKGGALIIDGMAFIQQLNPKKLVGPKTFQRLANVVLTRIVNIARLSESSAVHFVTDTYPAVSIKNAERKKRATHGSQLIKVYGQVIPQQWKKFLSNGQNKEALIKYFFETWSTMQGSLLYDMKVYLAHNQKCHVFSQDVASVKVQEVETLNCTHEEADTRMYLHAAFESEQGTEQITIVSPDTDVFVLGITFQLQLKSHLHFHTGSGCNLRTIDLKMVQEQIGDEVTKALIGLHCFTGCDSVSAFYSKGKKKALKLLQTETSFCSAFQTLGNDFETPLSITPTLEAFTCKLYAQHNDSDVNIARYNLFRLARRSEDNMPPTKDALLQHIKRVNYQAALYKRSLEQTPHVPSPVGNGWITEDGALLINLMDLPPAPDCIMELVNCSSTCKKGHNNCSDSKTCTCLQNKLPCTDLCKCEGRHCNNTCGTTLSDDELEDEDIEEE